jgi:AmmeMemoRadiSam system protein A
MTVPEEMTLTPGERQLLLTIARDSLVRYAEGKGTSSVEDYPLTPVLRKHCGAFVTLHKKRSLRGCIGYTKSIVSIAQAVADNAVNAGFRDPRFPPVRPAEVPEIDIEISVLLPGEEEGSPFIRVQDISEIVIGRDGLYLECGSGRGAGLLLPQVPVEQGWSLDAYLKGICMKAGVGEDGWRQPGSRLYRFQAEVFHELPHGR